MILAYHVIFSAYGFWLPNDPRGSPSPWGQGLWKVFLNSVEAIDRAIRYVEENPVAAGLRRQRWSFVRPWMG